MPRKTAERSRPLHVLIVDRDKDASQALSHRLEADGHESRVASIAAIALSTLAKHSFELILLDLGTGEQNGLSAIESMLTASPWARVVVMTAFPSVDAAVEAMKRGACDYLPKPISPARLRLVVQQVVESRPFSPNVPGMDEPASPLPAPIDFITTSAEMRRAIEMSRSAARGSAATLICGESGTGRRTLARAIHAWSARATRPLTISSCLAPNPAMLEAGWFGAIKKSPSGDVIEQPGRIPHTDGGTFVIEDVDRLPLVTQSKLLRLIQNHEYECVSDFTPRSADVRLIATTAADLDALAANGNFNTELLQALQTVTVDLPPLRRRQDDISILSERYRAFYARQTRRPVTSFSAAAMDSLRHHSWPGNVRELRQLIERAVLVCRSPQIERSDFPFGTLNRLNTISIGDPIPLERIEELHIRSILASAPSLDAAAATLGLDPATLWRRRKKYGI